VMQYQLPVKVAIRQWLPGNGQAVAGVLLRETLCLVAFGRCQPGLVKLAEATVPWE